MMSFDLDNITKPTLLLDKNRCLANIQMLSQKAKKSGIRFRPHFKTHQSATIGKWFDSFGVTAITVSSLDMAIYFAANGWKDITLAFPVNIREINRINDLASRIKLNLLVESLEVVNFLEMHLRSPVDVWIKVDVGYHRTGIPWDDQQRLKSVARRINQCQKLRFAGILTHAGNTYHAKSRDEINSIFIETKQRMQASADLLRRFGNSHLQISVGDTPCCSIAESFEGVDEVRPGNFVFYDVMQLHLGSCNEDQIALALACPVVAKHEQRKEMVVHGGAIHLSKEVLVGENGQKIFGYAVELTETGWSRIDKSCFVSSISQEHGIVRTNNEFFRKTKIGDLIAILPVHSCLTVNLMKKMITLEGEEIEVMR